MFADRLKKAMEYRQKTITDISENCGLSKGLISNYLNGKFNAKQKNIKIIADYLEISPSYLLGITDQFVIPIENEFKAISPINQEEITIKNSLIEEIKSICTFQNEETLRTILTIVKSLDKRK